MKTRAFGLFLFVLTLSFFACSKDSDDPKPGGNSNVGTFAGNIQVVDDPQTQLGYIYNAKVVVTTSGSNATVKITGTPGFDREYTGTYTSQDGLYNITLTKQTKPTEKVAGDQVIIINNKLTVSIDVASDNVTARTNPNTEETIQIAGKLSMIGTDMLKE